MKYSYGFLKQKQSLSLNSKIVLSEKRIREFYEKLDGEVYVSFSGGKDSTVLLDIIRSVYPDVPAVFVDTGLEYPEIREFVKKVPNVTWLKPEMTFNQVIKIHGYPVISKNIAKQIRELQNPHKDNESTRNLYLTGMKRDGTRGSPMSKLPKKWYKLIDAPFKISEKCCNELKKKPMRKYEKESGKSGFVGLMASDSRQRQNIYLRYGCNTFGKNNRSRPIGFWLNKNIWDYINKNNLKYCNIYDMGEHNTGCIFCMFGIHMEKCPNRFQRMEKTHPPLYKYCMEKLRLNQVLDYIGVEYRNMNRDIFDGGNGVARS